MEDRKVHYRHFMLLCFNSGKNASKTHDELCSVYGENAVSLRVCYQWFSKFRSGNFSIEDAPRSGRPTVIKNDQVKQIVDQNPQLTTRQIADIASVSKSTISRHLKEIGYVSKLDVWVPHQLTETQLNHRISTFQQKKLLELDWDVLPHPPYSPDLAPSDFYLFRSLQNFLDGKIFTGTEDIKMNLIQYFAQKEQKFFEKGIFNLPKRWEKVVEQNGQYIID